MYQFLQLYWQDALEILFFTYLFYTIALWLKKDRSHNLLPYFYGFILLYSSCYLLNLNSISFVLYYCWPICIILFMLMHQTGLQRNFVALKNNITLKSTSSSWLETLIATNLITLSNNKPVYCVIEHTDSIDAFMHTGITIQAPMHKELLELITTSTTLNHNTMIRVTTNGILHSVNSLWQNSYAEQQSISSHKKNYLFPAWANTTLLYTPHTDCCAFYGNPSTRTFTLIIKDKIISDLSAHQLLTILSSEYISSSKTHSLLSKQESSHVNVNHHKKSPHQQRIS